MEAQAGGGAFKSAFAPGSEVSGFSGSFPTSFDEGFSNDKDTEFYEPPKHGEPPIPAEEAKEGPVERGRDSRGAYHKDEGPPEPREPEEKRYFCQKTPKS